MKKIKKEVILKAFLLIAYAPFLFNFIAYGSGVPETHKLKAPLSENTSAYIQLRLTEVLKILQSEGGSLFRGFCVTLNSKVD